MDTIAALATPVGTSALAVIRVSGPAAGAIFPELPPRRAHLVDYLATDARLLDQVVATRFAAPASYSGEDMLEISCHGNPFIAQTVLEDLVRRGCRLAEPGEFTQRAFLNGKMELSQAEAIMDVVAARSERALSAAQQQLKGYLGREIDELSDLLVAALAQVEAYVDFPEEDLPVEDQAALLRVVSAVQGRTKQLLATQPYGELLRAGVRVALVGETNAGKSSLLNRLLGRDRALVSPEPGTTRDYLEEPVVIGPHLFRLIDTAGVNAAAGEVERMGIARTERWIEDAELVLLVIDASAERLPAVAVEPGRRLVVANKVDLGPPAFPRDVQVSAMTGAGIDELRTLLVARADALMPSVGPEQVAINARHAEALREAQVCLAAAAEKLGAGRYDGALVASDLRGALDALGRIRGRVDNEKILDALFRTFCIGK